MKCGRGRSPRTERHPAPPPALRACDNDPAGHDSHATTAEVPANDDDRGVSRRKAGWRIAVAMLAVLAVVTAVVVAVVAVWRALTPSAEVNLADVVAVAAEFVHGHDVGVVELREQLGLAHETPRSTVTAGQAQLDRYQSAQIGISCLEHDPVSTFSDLPEHFESADRDQRMVRY